MTGRPASPLFPHCGKKFSMVWKKSGNFFHTVENHCRVAAPVDNPTVFVARGVDPGAVRFSFSTLNPEPRTL